MNLQIVTLCENFLTEVGLDNAFYISVAAVSAAVVLNFVLCLSLRGYSALKRLWVMAFTVGINLLYLALCLQSNSGIVSFMVLLGVSIIGCSTVLVFPTRLNKIAAEHRLLARKIDNAVKEQTASNYDFPLQKPCIHSVEQPKENDIKERDENRFDNKDDDLNFTHVKNILSRLEYYQLSASDKRQVSELESAVKFAEYSGVDDVSKQKINDGLGALLKIMSKYGV